MEILPVSYLDIRLEHTPEKNEPGMFGEVMRKCLTIASKPGIKNTFTDEERELIVEIARGINIELDSNLYG